MKNNNSLGAGPLHLVWHALAVTALVTGLLSSLWMLLICTQRFPLDDVAAIPMFLFFLILTVAGIASCVFVMTMSTALVALWLKCGNDHLFFYRIGLNNQDIMHDLCAHLQKLGFSSECSMWWSRNKLIVKFHRDTDYWVLTLRTLHWNPDLKLNSELRKVADSIHNYLIELKNSGSLAD